MCDRRPYQVRRMNREQLIRSLRQLVRKQGVAFEVETSKQGLALSCEIGGSCDDHPA
jgi:hypothetical protein